MSKSENDILQIDRCPKLPNATLVLAFSGWMDGGDVSTGTVRRLIDLLGAEPFAEIDPEPFYIYNFPGSMELTSLFRPLRRNRRRPGQVDRHAVEQVLCSPAGQSDPLPRQGAEPALADVWRLHLSACRRGRRGRILFVGAFGGAVPHTRQPRLYVTCSDAGLLEEMEPYGVRRTGYQGPGSFTSYLMTRAAPAGLEMVSLVAEIPGYLQGANPSSIEAVTRRLAKILRLSLDLDSLRTASTAWELEVSSAVEQSEELAEKIRQLEEQYDNDLLELDAEDQ